MKKLISILVTLALLMTLCVPALAETDTTEITEEDIEALLNELGSLFEEAGSEKEVPAITSKDMTFYLCKIEDTRTLPVYFIGDSDVPYLSLEDWGEMYSYVMRTYVDKGDDPQYGLAFSIIGETAALTRTDGDPYPMTVDCAADTITFYDFDAFFRLEADRVLIDVF